MPSEFSLIRSLASIIDRHFPKRTRVINLRQKDIYSRMYAGLLDPEIQNEQILLDRIVTEPSQRNSFRVIRNQLKERLYNMMFMLDFSDGTASRYRKAIYANARTVFLTQTLQILGQLNLAVRLSRSGLKEARRFELTSNAIHFLAVLRQHAASTGDKTLFRTLSEEKKHYLARYSCELEAREILNLLTLELSITGTKTEALIEMATTSRVRISKIYTDHPTFVIGLDYFRISAIFLELTENFREGEELCRNATSFIDAHPDFQSISFYGTFAIRRLECLLQLGDYPAAIEAAAVCLPLYPAGSMDWFYYKQYEFQLRLHLLKFEAAALTWTEVTRNPSFELLPEAQRQRWELFEFYLEYVQGKFRDLGFAKRRLNALGRFRLNSTGYTKDKIGFNISILVIEFLILFESKQLDAMEEKADAMRVYRQRYLKGSPASSSFFQFLIMIAKNCDNPAAIKKWLGSEGEETEAQMENPTNNLEGIQIVPYSWVKQKIIESLEESLIGKTLK